jgi:hypothetical protein
MSSAVGVRPLDVTADMGDLVAQTLSLLNAADLENDRKDVTADTKATLDGSLHDDEDVRMDQKSPDSDIQLGEMVMEASGAPYSILGQMESVGLGSRQPSAEPEVSAVEILPEIQEVSEMQRTFETPSQKSFITLGNIPEEFFSPLQM